MRTLFLLGLALGAWALAQPEKRAVVIEGSNLVRIGGVGSFSVSQEAEGIVGVIEDTVIRSNRFVFIPAPGQAFEEGKRVVRVGKISAADAAVFQPALVSVAPAVRQRLEPLVAQLDPATAQGVRVEREDLEVTGSLLVIVEESGEGTILGPLEAQAASGQGAQPLILRSESSSGQLLFDLDTDLVVIEGGAGFDDNGASGRADEIAYDQKLGVAVLRCLGAEPCRATDSGGNEVVAAEIEYSTRSGNLRARQRERPRQLVELRLSLN
ncbi:MAG: hypothetical protein HY335_00240 [Deinococcus sp.]|nr:hypothetical protein [Deinococcus sp.]